MKILVTGKHGQLGGELCRKLRGGHEVIALGREDVDLSHEEQVRYLFRHLPRFSLLINCAAYTDVDRAESEPELAARINADAAELLAREARRRDIPMIHFSTDYIFCGANRGRPYTENDRPNPLSIYGQSKLEGENRIRDILEKHLIFRLSSLYGNHGRNFFLNMLGHFHRGKSPLVVHDQVVSPNCTHTIADAVTKIVWHIERFGCDTAWGIYHLGGSGETNWLEFARRIFEDARRAYGPCPAGPIGVSSREFAAPAARPAYSVLSSEKFQSAFGIEIPHWQVQYACFVRDMFFQ